MKIVKNRTFLKTFFGYFFFRLKFKKIINISKKIEGSYSSLLVFPKRFTTFPIIFRSVFGFFWGRAFFCLFFCGFFCLFFPPKSGGVNVQFFYAFSLTFPRKGKPARR